MKSYLRETEHRINASVPKRTRGGFLSRGSRRLRMLADSFHHHHLHAHYMRALTNM